MTFCFFVYCRASLTAASAASEPEFQKKNVSRDGCGITGSSFSINSRYFLWNAMLTYVCKSYVSVKDESKRR